MKGSLEIIIDKKPTKSFSMSIHEVILNLSLDFSLFTQQRKNYQEYLFLLRIEMQH